MDKSALYTLAGHNYLSDEQAIYNRQSNFTRIYNFSLSTSKFHI